MPKLPDFQALGEQGVFRTDAHQPSYSPQGFFSTAGGAAIEKSGNEMVSAGAKLMKEQEAEQKQLETAKAVSHMTTGLIDLQQEAANDPNFDPATFEPRARQLQTQAAGAFSDPRHRELFTLKTEDDIARSRVHIDNIARKRQYDAEDADTDQRAERNAELLPQTADPRQQQLLAQATLESYDGLAARGIITRQQALQKKQAWGDKVGTTFLQTLPPAERLKLLTPMLTPAAPDSNLKAADAALGLTPQERALYERHLKNLTGPGGVDNADGSRSTLYQASIERDGKTYNIPTVWDGKILPADEAIARADKEGLDKFPSYGSQQEAEARYGKMHDYMESDTAAFLKSRSGAAVSDAGGSPLPLQYQNAIKKSEGYAKRAEWDYKQHSSGWGTKAAPGEEPTLEEHQARFDRDIAKAASIVDDFQPSLPEGPRAALISLTYNSGSKWTSGGLGQAVRDGDFAAAKERFLQYNKAGGKENSGLVARRNREAAWFDKGLAGGNQPEPFKTGTPADFILPARRLTLYNQAQNDLRRDQAAAAAEFKGHLDDVSAEAMRTGTVANPPKVEDFITQLGPELGPKVHQDFLNTVQLGADMHAIAGMGPDERAAVRRQYEPRPGQEGYRDQAQRADIIDKALRQLSSDDAKEFKARLGDVGAEIARTGKATNLPSEEEFAAKLGNDLGPKIYKEFQRDIELGGELRGLGALDAGQRAAVRDRFQPQPGESYGVQAQRADSIEKASRLLDTEKGKDPAAYAIRYLPAVSDAFDRLNTTRADPKASADDRAAAARSFAAVTLQEQERVGVRAADRKIVPKEYVDSLNQALQTPATAGGTLNVAQQIEAEAKLWGDQWPLVYRQVAKDAAPVVRVIGSGVKPLAGQVLTELAHTPLKQILNDEDSERASVIKKDVLTQFKPLAQSMVGQEGAQRAFDDFQGQAEKLATWYVARGKTSQDAAKQAFDDLIGHKYEFRDGYRVPKAVPLPIDDIVHGADLAKRDVTSMALMPARDSVGGLTPDYLAAATARAYRRDGKWVTAPDESGLIFVYADQAVRLKDGGPLLLTWDDLARRAGAPAPAEPIAKNLPVFN